VHRTARPFLIALVLAALVAACTSGGEESAQPAATEGTEEATEGPRVVQPGAPGEPSRVLTPEEVAELDLSPPEHTEADVRFMQGMIPHHSQALVLTAMVEERTSREDIPLFAERIEISQEDEIQLMERWLEERGEEVPPRDIHESHGEHGDHNDHSTLMPGMLTQDEVAELESLSGEEFDRAWLEAMRRHHEGALLMVQELFSSDGGQEPQIWQFANHIDSDQRIEISRIDSMLADILAAADS
jgi:uncharacterized protein (DUF305 family)